ncbi:MAG TPA: UrcA family protein [Sphingobium sp.]|uniref:UrcA family protein n=1 Tax=Sphingobium sp. TaxID=1912891 RepID=UPI002ED5BF85
MKHLSAAIAVAGLLAAPAVAQAESSQKREPVSVTVVTRDLDLSRPENIARLRERMARAIAVACNPGNRLHADMKPDWQCRTEMGANAEVAMNRLLANPQGRVAS